MSPKPFNRHHIWYEQKNYTDGLYKDLRESAIVVMRKAGHTALHKAVEPPPQPTLEDVADLLDAQDLAQPKDRVEVIEFQEEWFATSYIHDDFIDLERQERNLAIANNLSRQMTFIKGNLWLPS